jgi:hypothetical protein
MDRRRPCPVIAKGPGYSILLTKHAISCILRTVFRGEVEIDRGGRLVELTMRPLVAGIVLDFVELKLDPFARH